jgi:hypothetical protein
MRWRVVLSVFVLATAIVAGADVFTQYGLDRVSWTNSFEAAVARGVLSLPSGLAKLKSLPPADRAAVVKALGAFAKTYAESADFKAHYQKAYTDRMGAAPTPPASTAAGDQAQTEADKAMAKMKEMMDKMPPEVQAQMKQALEEQQKAKAKNDKDSAQRQAKYEKDLAAYKARQSDPKGMPQDPHVALTRALNRFLSVTAGVDYAAPTRGASKVFVSKDLEAKSDQWKMCYRAGRDACEAARAFAQAWVAELK